MSKPTLATVWLDGCSGCHMSFLDLDEILIDLFREVDLVYSPIVDMKAFPEAVDITLVEGAVSSRDDWEKIQKIRKHTRILVSIGDCAVTGNVPGMRNPFPLDSVMDRAYRETVTRESQPPRPDDILPALLARVRPVHEVVEVDLFVPGCPPPAEAFHAALSALLAGQPPAYLTHTRFGR